MKRLLLLLCIFLSVAWAESVPKIYGQVSSPSTYPFQTERFNQTFLFDPGHIRVDIQLPVIDTNTSLLNSFFNTNNSLIIRKELFRTLLGEDYIDMSPQAAILQFYRDKYDGSWYVLQGNFSTKNEYFLNYKAFYSISSATYGNRMFLFDAKTGQRLHQDDIFKQSEALRQTIIEHIDNKWGITLSSIEPNDNFDITPDGLVIYYYNCCEIAPSERGIISVYIPIKTLVTRGLLVPNSPVVKYFAEKFVTPDTKKVISNLNEVNEMAKETLQKIMDENLTEMELKVLEATVVSKRLDNNGFNGIAIVRMANVKRLKVLFTLLPDKDSYYIEIPPAELSKLINEYDEL